MISLLRHVSFKWTSFNFYYSLYEYECVCMCVCVLWPVFKRKNGSFFDSVPMHLFPWWNLSYVSLTLSGSIPSLLSSVKLFCCVSFQNMDISTNKNELNLTENEMTLPVKQHRANTTLEKRKEKQKQKINEKKRKQASNERNFKNEKLKRFDMRCGDLSFWIALKRKLLI